MQSRLHAVIRCALVGGVLASLAACDGYSGAMKDGLQQALRDQAKGYTFSSYPMDNYGVGTAYEASGSNEKIEDRNFICATFQCLGIRQTADDEDAKLTLGGFAAKGTGGPVTLSDKVQRDVVLNAVLPTVATILNVGGKIESKSVTEVTLSFSSATIRKLDRRKVTEHLQGLPGSDPLKRSFQQGTLVMIVADVVATGLDVGVKLDTTRAAELNAKLNEAVNTVIGQDSNLSLKVSRIQDGQYHLKGANPLIVAVLPKHQPSAGVLGAQSDNDWNDWQAVKVGSLKNSASTRRVP